MKRLEQISALARMPDHPLVVSAAGGSLGSLVFALVRQFLEEPLGSGIAPAVQECFCGLDLDLDNQTLKVFLLGLLCGILFGPLVDLVWLLREKWRRFVLARVVPGPFPSGSSL